MDPIIGGALIGAGTNLLGNLFNGYSQKSAVKEANKGNMALAEYQFDRNYQMWQEQNAYNDPSSQMKRLESAGLNPNLVYGNGSVVGNTSGPAPQYNAPTLQPEIFSADFSPIANTALQVAQIEKTQQETRNLAYQNTGIGLDNDLKELQKIAMGYSNAKSKEEASMWSQLMDWKMQLMASQDKLNIANAMNADSSRIYRNGIQTELGKANKGLIEANTGLSLSNQVLNEFRRGLIEAQTTESLSRAGLNNQLASKVSYEITNLVLDAKLKGLTSIDKSYENRIKQILVEQGVDIRNKGLYGLSIDKFINSLNNMLGSIGYNFY